MADSKGRPKKKFKPAGAQLVQGLLAGADDVANRSWIGGGQGTPDPAPDSAPAAPVVDETRPFSPPRAPQPRGGEVVTPQAAVSVADPAPAPVDEHDSTPARPGVVSGARPKKASPAKKPAASAASRADAPSAHGSGERGPAAAASVDERPSRDQPVAVARPRRQQEMPGGAHAAIHSSFSDAKVHAGTWRAFGFRIAPDILALLKERVNTDRRTSGNPQLAIGHYLDAALRLVPGEVSELIDMATEFAMERIWDTEKTQPSTYRVGPDSYEWVANLNLALQEADFGRKGTQVISAVVQRYLDMLDSEGPLQRPDRRRNSP
ncbi:hypothetical protein AB0Q95_42770 [Streptomyces sp. NPDC059900]|uniref:hypothetical protein n=1 Tax=Streptomyces sp. NPDC059900 TaxID=3155816 RepID=UPI00342E9F61